MNVMRGTVCMASNGDLGIVFAVRSSIHGHAGLCWLGVALDGPAIWRSHRPRIVAGTVQEYLTMKQRHMPPTPVPVSPDILVELHAHIKQEALGADEAILYPDGDDYERSGILYADKAKCETGNPVGAE